MYLFFSVRSAGALLSAFLDEINVSRDDFDPMLSNFCNSEAQLPSSRFIIRYLFAPPVPFLPRGYDPRRATVSVSEHIWDTAQPQAIRTIYLAAHVNTNYKFESFQQDTLIPFEVYPKMVHRQQETGEGTSCVGDTIALKRCRPLTYTSTAAQDVKVAEANMGIDLEMSPVGYHEGDAYRTEKRCIVCTRDWGEYSERLGRLYLLRKLELEACSKMRSQRLVSLKHCVNEILSAAESELTQHVKAAGTRVSADAEATSEQHNFWRLVRMYKCLFNLYLDFAAERSERFSVVGKNVVPLSYLLRVERACASLHIKMENIQRTKDADPSLSGNFQNTESLVWKIVGAFRKTRFNTSMPLRPPSLWLWCFELKDLKDKNANSLAAHKVHFKDGVVSAVRAALAIITDPLSLSPCGVFDHVSSPSLVTIPAGPSYIFVRLSCVAHEFSPAETASLVSDPDPEAMRCVVNTFKRSTTTNQPRTPLLYARGSSRPDVHSETSFFGTATPRTIQRVDNNRGDLPVNQRQPRRRRGVNLVWLVCSYLGWELNERNAPVVDKKILVAAQWLSNSLACMPLAFSLIARWIMWITPKPYDYYLEGEPPFGIGKGLR